MCKVDNCCNALSRLAKPAILKDTLNGRQVDAPAGGRSSPLGLPQGAVQRHLTGNAADLHDDDAGEMCGFETQFIAASHRKGDVPGASGQAVP